MNTNEKNLPLTQVINIVDRSRLTLTGVEDVESFDENGIILKSNYGMIAIDGKELHISKLSVETGDIIVEGVIGGVMFFESVEKKRKRGLFR